MVGGGVDHHNMRDWIKGHSIRRAENHRLGGKLNTGENGALKCVRCFK